MPLSHFKVKRTMSRPDLVHKNCVLGWTNPPCAEIAMSRARKSKQKGEVRNTTFKKTQTCLPRIM